MKQLRSLRALVLAVALLALPRLASAEEPFRFEGTTCTPAAYLHCPDTECSAAMVINQGNVVEMKTRRTYFLDYPCDLKPGEKVTFILASTAPAPTGTGSATTSRCSTTRTSTGW